MIKDPRLDTPSFGARTAPAQDPARSVPVLPADDDAPAAPALDDGHTSDDRVGDRPRFASSPCYACELDETTD